MQLSLHNGSASGVTVVSNVFLDYYMPHANGEFVKIYLYLLRLLGAGQGDLTLAEVADVFSCTETDILRALRYWEAQRLLVLSGNASTQTSVDFLEPMAPPKKRDLPTGSETQDIPSRSSMPSPRKSSSSRAFRQPAITPPVSEGRTSGQASSFPKVSPGSCGMFSEASVPDVAAEAGVSAEQKEESPDSCRLGADRIRQLKKDDNVVQLLFIAEQYLGKTLSPAETSRLLYFYEELHFSLDLVEYLIEYCVSRGSKSIRYMEKVALAWHEAGITTVSMAKQETSAYNKNYFSILRAFGISNRNPVQSEISLMNHWLNDYGFTLDIITEACSRTVSQTGKASFQYADSILSKWKNKGVRHLTDIQALDTLHRQAQADRAEQKTRKAASSNRFNNFHQRDYDFDELEKQLLKQ